MIKHTPEFLNELHSKTGYGYETDDYGSDKNKIRSTAHEDKYGGLSEHMIFNGKPVDESTVIQDSEIGLDNNDTIYPETWENVQQNTDVSKNTNFLEKSKITSEDINNIRQGTTLYPVHDMLVNRFAKFARYGFLDPVNENSGAREYLFFSKPDLHLFNDGGTILNPELKSISFFHEAFKRYRYSMHCLQQYYGAATILPSNIGSLSEAVKLNSRFIPLLSNQVSSSLDLPTISATEITNNQNLFSINTSYREGSEINDCAYDFSLEFQDTKYLDTYMFFKIYDEYVRAKYKVEVTPNRDEYIMSKINPELFSIWKIIVDDTNRIIFWAKAIGVSPMSVPRDTMSNFETNGIKFTINMKAQFVKDMDPTNLFELNHLTAQSLGQNTRLLYEPDTWRRLALPLSSTNNFNMADTSWAAYPFVVLDNRSPARSGQTDSIISSDSDHKFYRLMWLSDTPSSKIMNHISKQYPQQDLSTIQNSSTTEEVYGPVQPVL